MEESWHGHGSGARQDQGSVRGRSRAGARDTVLLQLNEKILEIVRLYHFVILPFYYRLPNVIMILSNCTIVYKKPFN